jgi:hypothetical protein
VIYCDLSLFICYLFPGGSAGVRDGNAVSVADLQRFAGRSTAPSAVDDRPAAALLPLALPALPNRVSEV